MDLDRVENFDFVYVEHKNRYCVQIVVLLLVKVPYLEYMS